jgi:acetylornithine deacetylase
VVANDLLDECRTFVASNTERWKTTFQRLIQIPSPFEAEHEIVEFVSQYIQSLGVPVHKVKHDPIKLRSLSATQLPISEVAERYSLAVRLPGAGRGRSLAINTHLDIVPEGDASAWKYPPFAGCIDEAENVIYGRGAMDDKAGVTVSLAVLETLLTLSPRLAGDVIFHYVLEDEITGNGTLLCISAGYGADAAMIMDGTRPDKAINQHAGNMQFELKLQGKPASVSVSHMGTNAAEMMARLLIHLRDAVFALNAARCDPWTRFPSPYQLVIQKLHSEGEQLTVPELARAQCYVTFPPPFTLVTAREFLQEKAAVFARANALTDLPEFAWVGYAVEPVASDAHQMEQVMQRSATRLDMAPIDVGPSTGTSDMRHFLAAGSQCLLYGPGSGFNPHRPDEHYYLEDLPRMILFYLDVTHEWCGKEIRAS